MSIDNRSNVFSYVLLAACALGLSGVSATASAQDGDDIATATRLHVRGLVTGGGEVTLDTGDDSASDDLVVGGGGAVELEVPVARFLSLGVAGTLTAWQADIEDDDAKRNFLVDVDFVPRLRAPVGADGRHAIYLAVPIGLAIDFPSDDYADAVENIGGELSNGVGLHVGGRLGAQVFVTERFGFVAEGGIDYRTMRHRIEGPLGGDDHFRLNMYNFTGQLGIVVAL